MAQVKSGGRERSFLLQVLSNLHYSMGKEEPGNFHPITNDWRRAWVFPSQVSAIPEHG
jgi:hypothetical protein